MKMIPKLLAASALALVAAAAQATEVKNIWVPYGE